MSTGDAVGLAGRAGIDEHPAMLDGLARATRDTLLTLVDLVLPSACGGCGAEAPWSGVCDACGGALAGPPGPTRPTPAPAGLPRCLALGPYEGALRELILAYKERGGRRLAAPLGDALAEVVRAGLGPTPAPVALVPVPATAAAARARQGDHMLRLARRAARRLRGAGRVVTVATPLRARPKQDSTHLDRQARARVALAAFTARSGGRRVGPGDAVVVVDDVITTGSTLAAVTGRMAERGVVVAFAATLAATRLRRVGSLPPIGAIAEADPPIRWDGSWNWG